MPTKITMRSDIMFDDENFHAVVPHGGGAITIWHTVGAQSAAIGIKTQELEQFFQFIQQIRDHQRRPGAADIPGLPEMPSLEVMVKKV